MGTQFFSQLLNPRQMCSSWHSAPALPVCCGTRSASAIYCSSCEFPFKHEEDKMIPHAFFENLDPLTRLRVVN